MSNIAIGVEGLGKKYRLGANAQPYKTMRESLNGMASMPLRAASRLARRSVEDGGRGHRPEFWALKGVSFEVKHGEVLGIIGRNGAGKSTLLKLLSQITEPTEGRIGINGRVASLLEVGTGFHPELTGRENVYLNGAILGMSRQEIARKFDEIVAFAEVEKFVDTQVKYYSSGMYLRLAFSVAAHLEPEVLIVDEVLAVGDASFQKKCLGKMETVSKEGRAVLVVSHNMEVIEALCSSAYLFDKGHLIQSGNTHELVRKYLEMGGPGGEVHRVRSRELRWTGILNRSCLDNLSPNDDLTFVLGFEAGDQDLERLFVDCTLHDSNDQIVIHTKSKFVSDGFHVPKQTRFQVACRVVSPKIVAGFYHLTVYVYCGANVLLWVEQVDACHVGTRSYFGKTEYFDDLKSYIIPEYTVDCEIKERITDENT